MRSKSFYLLKKRNFFPLFLTQFFGAFNDNAFKLSMLTLISYYLSQSQMQSERYQAIAAGLFTLPFFIFSASFGQIADTYDKAILIRWIKVFECLLMMLGSLGLYTGHIALLMLVLFGMGMHSSFFGPIKYSILPESLPKEALLGATGLIESSTFLAILLGTTLGALSVKAQAGGVHLAIILVNISALLGLFASFFIPRARQSTDHQLLIIDRNILRATFVMLNDSRKTKQILMPILAISWFWFIGSVILTKLPDYTHFVLQSDNNVFAFFLALFSVGIGSGAVAVNKMLGGRVNMRLLPWLMLLLSGTIFDLWWATPPVHDFKGLYSISQFLSSALHWRLILDFFILSFSAGLFVVPLYTYLQIFSDEHKRARTIAVNNIYNAFFMVMGALVVMLFIKLKFTIPQFFLLLSLLNFFVAVLLFRAIPRIQEKASDENI